MTNDKIPVPAAGATPPSMKFCCKMREKFLIGIVAERTDLPTPVEAVDSIDFEQKSQGGRTIVRIKFCPFCGKAVDGPLRVAEMN